MTLLAEMGGAPTEPLGNGTAETALELYELLPMLLTLLNRHYVTTVGTYQVGRVELPVVISLVAIFESSEIGLFALESKARNIP